MSMNAYGRDDGAPPHSLLVCLACVGLEERRSCAAGHARGPV